MAKHLFVQLEEKLLTKGICFSVFGEGFGFKDDFLGGRGRSTEATLEKMDARSCVTFLGCLEFDGRVDFGPIVDFIFVTRGSPTHRYL